MNESKRVENSANWYKSTQLNFDRELVRFRFLTSEPHLKGPHGLELGTGDGAMTKFLRKKFETLTIVDAAEELLEVIPNGPDLVKVHALFEDFKPAHKFDTIVMEHILEHVDKPVEILKLAKSWLKDDGVLIIGVPNAKSIHRLAGVRMGLLKSEFDLNERDHMVGHRRVYSWETLRKDLEAADLKIEHMDGVFLKPVSNGQIDQNWSPEMIESFYLLGKDFPQNAAEISAVCRK